MDWYYDKDDLRRTVSVQAGLPFQTECRYRQEGARFIINAGTKMDLGHNTMATGVVYFHRFYMFHSFKTIPRYLAACSCLFLAGKVEETPKKCKDIVKIAKALLPEDKYETLGKDPKEEVMSLERILLKTIKFDMEVDHPYQFLTKYAKCLKGDKVKLTNVVQMAWTFVNDSLCTTLCLQWEPEVIAVSLMHLACKLSKFELLDWEGRTSKHSFWWDMFVEGMNLELLEDICHQVLDLYALPDKTSAQSSPPALDKFVVPKKIVPPPSVNQKLLLYTNAAKCLPKSEEVVQFTITKKVKMASTPNASSSKPLLPILPRIKPLPLNSVLPPKKQNIPNPILPPPPMPPKLLQQMEFKKPPLPLLYKPPLPLFPPPLSIPPPTVPPSLQLSSQGFPKWPQPTPPPPTPPSAFPRPMFPLNPPLHNTAHSLAQLMLTQPPNLTNSVSRQHQLHESVVSMDINCKSGPLIPPYGRCYSGDSRSQQKWQPPPNTNREFEIQGSYEISRQKYTNTHSVLTKFNRDDGVFGGGGYSDGSQHYGDSRESYSYSDEYYDDSGSQYYPDPDYRQFSKNMPNKRGFNNQNNRLAEYPPQYNNRQFQKRPYQKRY